MRHKPLKNMELDTDRPWRLSGCADATPYIPADMILFPESRYEIRKTG
jgi:hypothetical protein